ncbi:MAG: EamA family transporter [Paenibacillus sp.]|jgi:drug/metabolite transporter (DMT)-like permease|uniref:DMT family transporter n=1 Tax=Paenibacillus sp. TaxID=58172 RepID=UPI0029083D18|nr:EamA family transporter [Paenibacillus sp.]MDU4696151.1 EamA family transporter [Paenibacillus sp.]
MSIYKYTGLLVLTTFLMGTAYPVAKLGMGHTTPLMLMGIRFFLAGGLLALFSAKKPQPQGAKQWLQIVLLGLIQSVGVMGFTAYSMRWITSGESAIISSTSPLMMLVWGALMGTAYRVRQWFGVVIGFIGVVITFGLHISLEPGTVFALAGAFCFTVATLMINRMGSAFDKRVLAAYQMLAGGVMLLILSFAGEKPTFELNVESGLAVVWLVLFCSILQFTLWFYLLSHSDPGKTSSFLFLIPIFSVICSWLLLGEHIAWYVYVGGALTCAGVFLVNWQGNRKPKAKEETKEASSLRMQEEM